MESKFASYSRPIFAFNKKRESLYSISKTSPSTLIQYNTKTEEIREKCLQIDFMPTKLNSGDDFVIIQGKDELVAYSIETDTLISLGNKGSEILDIGWHSLSNTAIGVLTRDNFLSLYSLPSKTPDFRHNFFTNEAISFCFFAEKPKNLFRFGCAVLMKNGQVHILSPVVPKNFIIDKDILDFFSIINIPGNSYVKYEPQIREFFSELDNKMLQESKN